MIKGLEEKLRIPSLFSLQKRTLRGALIAVYNFLRRGNREGGADFFNLVSGDMMRGNGLKLHEGELTLDIRKKFFTEMLTEHWNKLPREAVMAPGLLVLNEHLDKTLRYMVKLLGCPVRSQELNPMILFVTFQFRIFYDSVKYNGFKNLYFLF